MVELTLAPGAPQPLPPDGKPPFPRGGVGQTALVVAALSRAQGALDAGAIASRFRQGRRVAPKVSAILGALHRLGEIDTGDGTSFALPRSG